MSEVRRYVTWTQRKHIEELRSDPARASELREIFNRLVEYIRLETESNARFNRLFLQAWQNRSLGTLWDRLRPEFPADTQLHYFIRARGLGDIKIGRTNNIERRFGAIENGCSRGAALIACFPGDGECEADLKARFENDRLNGEWFTASSDMLDYLRRLGSDVDDFDLETYFRRHLVMPRPREIGAA